MDIPFSALVEGPLGTYTANGRWSILATRMERVRELIAAHTESGI
jgi:hypothetical protein